jgi:hypothetical protein
VSALYIALSGYVHVRILCFFPSNFFLIDINLHVLTCSSSTHVACINICPACYRSLVSHALITNTPKQSEDQGADVVMREKVDMHLFCCELRR